MPVVVSVKEVGKVTDNTSDTIDSPKITKQDNRQKTGSDMLQRKQK